MARFVWLLPLAAALALLAPVRADDAAKKKELAELLDKLKAKRDAGGTHAYKLEFEHTFYTNGAPRSNYRVVEELRIDWATGKFGSAGWNGRPLEAFEQIDAYDGEKVRTKHRPVTKDGKPTGDGSWKYGLGTGRQNSRVFQREFWPVFLHRGVTPGLHELFYPGHLTFAPDPDQFFVQTAVHNGTKCISLKTFAESPTSTDQYEYLIDPAKDHAVVAFAQTREGQRMLALDITVVPGKKKGQWVPSEWAFTLFGGKQVPEVVIKAKVVGFTDDGVNGFFDVTPPEGAKVGRSHYEWPKGAPDQKITFYEYVVKDGRLIPPPPPTPMTPPAKPDAVVPAPGRK